MDKAEFVAQIQADCRRIMEQVADAVNNAPTGNVISGSEMQVRDLMAELRHKAYQTAVQMRIDSHESTFSPSEGRGRETAGRQRALPPSRRAGIGQRADQLVPAAVVRGPGGQRLPGG
jgi:acyl transferase domain-containing protein